MNELAFDVVEQCVQTPFAVVVRRYTFGQFRIQILGSSDESDIRREMCTYRHERAAQAVTDLIAASDPLELAESWAHAGNCELPGHGRIRLDQ